MCLFPCHSQLHSFFSYLLLHQIILVKKELHELEVLVQNKGSSQEKKELATVNNKVNEKQNQAM